MKRKILKNTIILTLVFIFGISCLKDEKMSVGEIKIQDTNLLTQYSNIEYRSGDILEIPLTIKNESINAIGFDLILNMDKFEINNIIKNNFTEDANLVASKKIKNGYHIMFSDFEKKLQTDENFAKINLLVKWSGEENIEIKNIIKE